MTSTIVFYHICPVPYLTYTAVSNENKAFLKVFLNYISELGSSWNIIKNVDDPSCHFFIQYLFIYLFILWCCHECIKRRLLAGEWPYCTKPQLYFRKYFLVFSLLPSGCSALSNYVQAALVVAKGTANKHRDNQELSNEHDQSRSLQELQQELPGRQIVLTAALCS